MRVFALAFLAIGVLVGADDPKPEEVRKDLDALKGTWTITKLERDGEELLPVGVRLEAQFGESELSSPNIKASYKLDPSRTPKAIDLSYTEGPAAGQTVKGIYKLEGDTLAICRPLPATDERPKEFSAAAGSGRMLLLFKRSKPDTP
jgi:uncharacterized protein (TIGR03067 family)